MPQRVIERSTEFWLLIVALMMWMAAREGENAPIWRRLVKVSSSAIMAIALAPALSVYFRDSEMIAGVVVMAFGQLALDAAVGIVADREFLREIIRARLGGGK